MTTEEIAKAQEWCAEQWERDNPNSFIGYGTLAAYAAHVTAEKDKEIEMVNGMKVEPLGLDDRLPCVVYLPPSLCLGLGTTVRTLMAALAQRRRWVEEGKLRGDLIQVPSDPTEKLAKILGELAKKDAEIERLRAENDRLRKMVEPKWFYPGPEYEGERCCFSEDDVVQDVLEWDGRPGEVRVIEISRATPLPTVWACAKVLTDEEKLARRDDEDFVFTLHDSEEAAEAKKAALEGEKADG